MQIGLLKLAPYPKECADPDKLQLLDRAKTAESSGTLQDSKKPLYFRIIKGDILSTLNWILSNLMLFNSLDNRKWTGSSSFLMCRQATSYQSATIWAVLNILDLLHLYKIEYIYFKVWVYTHILGCSTFTPAKTSPASVRKQDYLSLTRPGPDLSHRHKDQIPNIKFCSLGGCGW